MKKSVKKPFFTESRIRLGAKILAGILAVSFLLMAFAVFRTQILPGKYLGGFFIVSTLATAAVVYLQLAKKLAAKKTVILGILSIVMILGNIGIYTAGMMTSSLLNSVQGPQVSYDEYSIVAIKANQIKLSTPGQTVGFLNSDTVNADVKPEAAKHTDAAARDFTDPTSMFVSLQGGEIQLATFKSSYLTVLKELNNNELYQQLEVLATFKVKSVNSNNTAQADINKPYIIYISGIDTYGAISTVSRSDVNILAVVNPRTHKILLVNTPRDYYVQLNGTTGTRDKLTHAGLYGVDTSVKTMEDLYGVDINYNIRINFSSLVKIVDALGGVDVYSEYNFSAGGHQFTQGNNSLNGDQALAFSRERYSFEGGDRTRGENQLRVIRAIIAKLSTPAAAANAQQIVSAMGGAFQTNMSSDTISAIIRNQLDSMAKWSSEMTSVDGTGATDLTYSTGNARLYVMVPDQATVDAAKQKIQQYIAQ